VTPYIRWGLSRGCCQAGLLLDGLLVFADAAEQAGEVAGGEFPVEQNALAFWL
jgi:hypothetical protein